MIPYKVMAESINFNEKYMYLKKYINQFMNVCKLKISEFMGLNGIFQT